MTRGQRRVRECHRDAHGVVFVAALVALAALAAVSACSANSTTAGAGTTRPSTSTSASTHVATGKTSSGQVAGGASSSSSTTRATAVPPLRAGSMPPVANPRNVYSEAGANMFSPAVASARRLVYVPSPLQGGRGTVDVIDQDSMTVVDHFTAGAVAQHVVPSWDMTMLYVNASAANQLVPIDPTTGKPGTPIAADRPYNLYFTPDGTRAVVQDEQHNRLDYYDPHTWKLLKSVPSTCRGNNHADWSADGSYFLVTCEFSGEMLKVDTKSGDLLAKLSLEPGSMPQDVRLVPDGSKFYVADMMHDGVWVLDGSTFKVTGKIDTGVGAHGIYPSRDGTLMYVANRGRHMNDEKRLSHEGDGSVSVIDPVADKVTATWSIPGGGSPDMGDVSADGTKLWLSGRYDSVVYVFDTATGQLLKKIPVSKEPHGLCVWPQPGRYSLGHTGNTR